jgi:hypothetical protein
MAFVEKNAAKGQNIDRTIDWKSINVNRGRLTQNFVGKFLSPLCDETFCKRRPKIGFVVRNRVHNPL